MSKKVKKLTLEGRIKPLWLARILNIFVLPIFGSKKVNRIFRRLEGKQLLDFIDGIIDEVGVSVQSKGIKNIPLEGAVTVAGNHPGGMDIIAYARECVARRFDTQILVNEQLNFEQIAHNIIPITKDRKAIFGEIDRAYKNCSCVVFNPAGQNARHYDGILRDPPWKKKFLDYALQYKTPLVMFYVTGRNHGWWYRLTRLREILGIKMRIEAFFMMWNFTYPRDREIQIRFAPIIDYHTLQKLVDKLGTLKTVDLLYQYVHIAKCDVSFERFLEIKTVSAIVQNMYNQ